MTQNKPDYNDPRICIDVSGMTVEQKKEVQDMFFELGYCWHSSGKVYTNLDKCVYANTYFFGGLCGNLLTGYFAVPKETTHLHTFKQLKERVMLKRKEKNTFTKDMLEAGKHVVECANGNRYLFVGNDILLGVDGFMTLSRYSQNLCIRSMGFDIMKVHELTGEACGFERAVQLENTIWQRDVRSQEQILKDKKIKELQEKLEEAQQLVEETQKELGGLK